MFTVYGYFQQFNPVTPKSAQLYSLHIIKYTTVSSSGHEGIHARNTIKIFFAFSTLL